MNKIIILLITLATLVLSVVILVINSNKKIFYKGEVYELEEWEGGVGLINNSTVEFNIISSYKFKNHYYLGVSEDNVDTLYYVIGDSNCMSKVKYDYFQKNHIYNYKITYLELLEEYRGFWQSHMVR